MQSGSRQRVDDNRHQARPAELRGRNIDGDAEMLRPARGGKAGLPDHPFAKRQDEADLFRQRNEGRGWDLSILGMVPAEQRLETGDFVALQIDHRLVVEFELAGRQRLAQIELHDPAGLHLLVHPGLEKAERAAAIVLGAVERKVGISEQLVGRVAVARTDRYADAGADERLLVIDIIRLADPGNDLLRGPGRFGGLGDRRLNDHEFVAAGPCDRVGLAYQPGQAFRNDPEQLSPAG